MTERTAIEQRFHALLAEIEWAQEVCLALRVPGYHDEMLEGACEELRALLNSRAIQRAERLQ